MTRAAKTKAPAKQANPDYQIAYVEKELEALFDTLEPSELRPILNFGGGGGGGGDAA